MKKIICFLLILVFAFSVFGEKGTPRGVMFNLLDAAGTTYYFETEPDYFTFTAWIDHGDSLVITEQSSSAEFEMMYLDSVYYSTLIINLSEFSSWEVGDVLIIDMKDWSNDWLVKNTKEFCGYTSFTIPEGTNGILIGFDKIPESIGSPIIMGSCGGINENGFTPNSTTLKQNYPNPFNPTTTIEFGIKKKGMVSLNIYNQEGKIVRNAVDNFMNAGKHSVGVDLSNVSAGTYYYILKIDGVSEAKKMVLVK